MYKRLGIKGELSLKSFIIFGIFSSLELKFHYYPKIYSLASSTWTFVSMFWKVYKNLAGALWSLADWEEVGEKKPRSVPIQRLSRAGQRLLCVGLAHGWVRGGLGHRDKGSG